MRKYKAGGAKKKKAMSGTKMKKAKSGMKMAKAGLKKVKPSQKGLAKLPTAVRNKMGFAKKGKTVKKAQLGSSMSDARLKKNATATKTLNKKLSLQDVKLPTKKTLASMVKNGKKVKKAGYGKTMKAKSGSKMKKKKCKYGCK